MRTGEKDHEVEAIPGPIHQAGVHLDRAALGEIAAVACVSLARVLQHQGGTGCSLAVRNTSKYKYNALQRQTSTALPPSRSTSVPAWQAAAQISRYSDVLA